MQLHPGAVQIHHVLELSPPGGTQVHDVAHIFLGGHEAGLHVWLLRQLNFRRVRIVEGVVHHDHRAVGFGDPVNHVGGGGDEIQIVLPLQSLLDDLHVQQAQKAAAEAKAQSNGALRLIGHGGIVQFQLFQSFPQILVLGAIGRVHAGKHHGLHRPVAGQCPQDGDEKVVPFSFMNDDLQKDQVKCWLTYTNEETHDIIRANLDRSPIYAGIIEGTGPRYCPSIEDKVVRFADKNRHQVFIEPEGLYTNEMYIGGMSSSLPEDVQYQMYRSVAGLENARIVKSAYAIEYDCIDARQLNATLEFKNIKGLFSAGQFNGSSGYEEAAAQGLVAGINAALKIQGRDFMVLDRSEAYIGVLIDDLVTKENHEPYRMMTSRAEYRLLLRQDNADLRLRKKGYEVGLIDEEVYQRTLEKERLIEREIKRIEHVTLGASEAVQNVLERYQSTALKSGTTLAELIRRPELNYEILAEIDPERPQLPWDVKEQVNINIKYDGYIRRQKKQVEQFKKLEEKKIPENIDYDEISGLRIEAKQKLKLYRPMSIGQASRIAGVSPADVSVLLVYMPRFYKKREGE